MRVRFLQHAQVARERGRRDVGTAGQELADRGFAQGDAGQDGAARGVGKRREGEIHRDGGLGHYLTNLIIIIYVKY